MADAIELDADAQVPPGAVPRPLKARPHDHGRSLLGLGLGPDDRARELTRRPRGVHQRQVIVGHQRRRHRPRNPHRAATQR